MSTSIPGVPQLSQAAAALSNLALVTPVQVYGYGPINAFTGVPIASPMVFTYEGQNTVELDAEVTDHILESNSTANQHVALKPELITVHGFKGELEELFPSLGPAGQVAQAVLGVVGDFAPSFSASAQNVINQANQAYQEIANSAAAAVGAWNTITGEQGNTVISSSGIVAPGSSQNHQQALFSSVYGYWRQQIDPVTPVFFNVQTPWAIFTPCALVRVRAVQEEDSAYVTDFFLTFKLIRSVGTSSGTPVAAGRAGLSLSSSVNNGTISPGSAPSLMDQLAAQGLP